MFDKAEVVEEERKPNHLIIAVTSDRGLCGGIHSNVARSIRNTLGSTQDRSNTKVVCVGDKTRTIIQRFFRDNLLLHFTDVGKKPPVFEEAMFVAQNIIETGFEYESAELVYNRFKWVSLVTAYKWGLISSYMLVFSIYIFLWDCALHFKYVQFFHVGMSYLMKRAVSQ